MGYLDLGGGLAVDYDGSHTNYVSSRNYTLDEYCADVVEAIMSILDEQQVAHPHIITESGRATVAYYSVLLFNVLDVSMGPPPAWCSRAGCVRKNPPWAIPSAEQKRAAPGDPTTLLVPKGTDAPTRGRVRSFVASVFQAVDRRGNAPAKVDKVRGLPLGHGDDGRFAQQPAKGNFLAHALAGNGNKAHRRGFVVDHGPDGPHPVLCFARAYGRNRLYRR